MSQPGTFETPAGPEADGGARVNISNKQFLSGKVNIPAASTPQWYECKSHLNGILWTEGIRGG